MELILVTIATLAAILVAFTAQGHFLRSPRIDGGDEGEQEEPAFPGGARFEELSPARVEQIRPFIDRAGLLSYGERSPTRREGNDPIFTFEIYLLDSNGETHTVAMVEGHDRAAQIALKVAETFDVPLDDPDFVTAGRGGVITA